MKRHFLFLLFVVPGIAAAAQDTVTLFDCYRKVEQNFPLARQPELIDQASDLRVKNLNKAYLPGVNLNASASYQNDVPNAAPTMPAGLSSNLIVFPLPDKDQYKVSLDVNQFIYDGNVTHYQKKVEGINRQADQKNVAVQLYQLKDQVNQLYFSIFLLQQNEKLLRNSRSTIESRLKELRAAVAAGTQLQSSADALDAELILLDQQLAGLTTDRKAAFAMLSELISAPVPENSILNLPAVAISSFVFENKRPENELYDLQLNRNSMLKQMVTTKWNPKLSAYGQLGYGKPGFNVLSNDFTVIWIVGGKLSWNFWNWNQNRNEKKIYDIQGGILTTQKETFDKNLRIASEKNLAEIIKLTDMLTRDDELIALRERIVRTASSQLDNGTITSGEYINRVNDEIMAKLNKELHSTQLVRAKINYLFTLGKL